MNSTRLAGKGNKMLYLCRIQYGRRRNFVSHGDVIFFPGIQGVSPGDEACRTTAEDMRAGGGGEGYSWWCMPLSWSRFACFSWWCMSLSWSRFACLSVAERSFATGTGGRSIAPSGANAGGQSFLLFFAKGGLQMFFMSYRLQRSGHFLFSNIAIAMVSPSHDPKASRSHPLCSPSFVHGKISLPTSRSHPSCSPSYVHGKISLPNAKAIIPQHDGDFRTCSPHAP